MIRCLFRSSRGDTFGDLPLDQLADALANKDGTVWLDVAPEAGGSEKIVDLLHESFSFHPLALDDAFHETHVPRVHDWGEYLFIVLHAAELAADGSPDLGEIDLFLGKNYLVSVHEASATPLERLWDRCRQKLLASGPVR